MVTVCSPSFSISISTSSPTATGLVEVMLSILKMPLMRAWNARPSRSFTIYQLPVDLYTIAFMDVSAVGELTNLWKFSLWKLFEQGIPQQDLQQKETCSGDGEREKLFGKSFQSSDLNL